MLLPLTVVQMNGTVQTEAMEAARYVSEAEDTAVARYVSAAEDTAAARYVSAAEDTATARYVSAAEDTAAAPRSLGDVMWNSTAASSRDAAVRLVTGGLLSLLILWTLLGNILVCTAVLRFRSLRSKVTNVFIVSLALSDLFVAVLVMPWKAVTEVSGYWPFGAFCDVWVAFDIMCSTASILNLCVISVDRYWAISAPFCYERKMTQRVAFVMIGVTWTLSVLISFIPVQLNWHKAAEDVSGNMSERALEENCDSSLSREYAISSSLISFYIPVAIMIVTYTRIYRIAQMQIRRIASLERAAEHAQSCRSRLECQHHTTLKTSIKRETKVLKTLSVIMGVFVCCWLPFFVLNCMVPFCKKPVADRSSAPPCVSETTFNVFVWFGWTNSSLNPVIYAFNAEFRKAFASLLGCHYLCTSTTVETVNISNELVSYHHDTLIHKEIASAYIDIIPNVVECLREDGFDRISQSSHNATATDSACDDDDPDIGLELSQRTNSLSLSPSQRTNGLSPSQRTNSLELSPSQRTNSLSLSPSQRTNGLELSLSQRTNGLSPSQRTNSLSPSQRTNGLSLSPSQRTNGLELSLSQRTNSLSLSQRTETGPCLFLQMDHPF